MRLLDVRWPAALALAVWMAWAAAPVCAAPLPLAFEENRGQTDPAVRLLARGNGAVLFLTPAESVFVLRLPSATASGVIRLRWTGTDPAVRIVPEAELPGRSHHLSGTDPKSWRTDLRTYGRARYVRLRPGLDLILGGDWHRLVWELEIAPDASPTEILLNVEGVDRAEVDPEGDLVLGIGGAAVRLARPRAWQASEKGRRELAARWRLARTGPALWSVVLEPEP